MEPEKESWLIAFESAWRRGDSQQAISILEGRNKFSGTPSGSDKVLAMRAVQCLARNQDQSFQWVHLLMHSPTPAARSLGAMLAADAIADFYAIHPQETRELILSVADDDHWEVRESANDLMLPLLKRQFGPTYAWLKSLASHPSENIRRAVVLTVKKAGKERRPEWGKPLLDLLEGLLSDRSPYVRRNLGPFGIGDGLLRYYPQLTLEALRRWSLRQDEQVRWNVAMAFASAEAARHVDQALDILKTLASDERRFVWRAVASALRNLGCRKPGLVLPILTAWRDDPQTIRPALEALKWLGDAPRSTP